MNGSGDFLREKVGKERWKANSSTQASETESDDITCHTLIGWVLEAGSSEVALIIVDLCQVRATESYPDRQL